MQLIEYIHLRSRATFRVLQRKVNPAKQRERVQERVLTYPLDTSFCWAGAWMDEERGPATSYRPASHITRMSGLIERVDAPGSHGPFVPAGPASGNTRIKPYHNLIELGF